LNDHVTDDRVRQLSPAECREKLRSAAVGRVGVSVRAMPAIFPIRFAMLDDHVVFRIPPDGTLARALPGAVVAFEVDGGDNPHTGGWSVLVVGLAELITWEADLDAARRLPLARWGTDDGDRFARISCQRTTGRQLGGPGSTSP
jgi:nitroimidazol reductase NimA-like FMN-containing flavoprotein (pyridoxamine 5'-phosphate oxidase superfamily)